MKFYVIPPVANLNLMLMGDRIFVLAHLYLKYPKYREFVNARRDAGWFITLDNSAAERSLVTEDVLIDLVKTIRPNEVIAPDVLFDARQTLKNLESFIIRLDKEDLLNEVEVFGVPQGSNKDEWFVTYCEMANHPFVQTIGLSKIAVPKCFLNEGNDQGIMRARQMCVAELIEQDMLVKPIHCLGMGDINEFSFYRDMPLIRSTDSCYSVLAAMHGIKFVEEDGGIKRIPTPHDYFEMKLTEQSFPIAESNILFMRELLH